MYIRRKVFSVAIDQTTGEEKLFSTTEIISEEAYQKMYAEAEKKDHKTAKGAAIGAGATVGTAAGAAGISYGAGKLAKHMQKGRVEEVKNAKKSAQSVVDSLKNDEGLRKMHERKGTLGDFNKQISDAEQKVKNVKLREAGKAEKILRKIGKPMKKFVR